MSLFGHLVFDTPLRPSRRIETTPYTLVRGERDAASTPGVWSFGALSAATAPEYSTVERDDASRYEHLTEPLTSYNVVRLQRDILAGSSNIGALVTGVSRDEGDDAYRAGIDYNLRWDQNRAP